MQTSENIQNLVSHLKDLVELLNDGCEGYNTLADTTKDLSLKQHFNQLVAQRKNWATTINKRIVMLGQEPEMQGDVKGMLHRTWINLKTAVSSNEDAALLEEAITGDSSAAESFASTLKHDALTFDVRQELEDMHSGLEEAVNTNKHKLEYCKTKQA